MHRLAIQSAIFACALLLSACDQRPDESKSPDSSKEVVVYCSVDREFAEPILAEFEKRNQIKVHRVFDTEAGKTTGLINRLIAEKTRPRADVWWSSEIFGTIQLAEQGVLAEFRPPSAADIPELYRDPAGRWTAFGLRGRVLAFDPKRTKREELPMWWGGLTDPKYKGRICMADPRFGTTRGHMATMLNVLGPAEMKKFLEGLRNNDCRLTDGNSQSVVLLTRGTVDFAMTDTDDVYVARARGDSVNMERPNLADPAKRLLGTLWIPCTVAVVGNGPSPEAAQALGGYLISAEVEEKLAFSGSRNLPVRPNLCKRLGYSPDNADKIDYAAVAKKLDESDQLIRDILLK